jgi:8-oxo-dGTP pyrophosphatase MutT (NUDIX family)
VTSPAEPAAAVRAAGGVLWRPVADGAGIEAAVVHRPRYDDWSLPKGKPEDGEAPLETAVREVAEETGLTVVVGRRGVRTRYAVDDGTGGDATKLVDYWLMQCVGGEFAANAEVDDLRWLPPDAAAELCSYEHDRAVLADLARTDVPRAPTLLLVRHGRAGDKTEWDGPDDLRPLDAKGRRQAQRLAEVLPHFGPTSVLSARRTRCEQTVAPLADRLAVPVLPLEPLGEEEFQRDPEAGLAAVEQLLAERSTPGVTVVCSQGGAIPSVLMALGVRWQAHGPAAGRLWPPAAKGSVWALGGRTGDVSADYYRNFDPT